MNYIIAQGVVQGLTLGLAAREEEVCVSQQQESSGSYPDVVVGPATRIDSVTITTSLADSVGTTRRSEHAQILCGRIVESKEAEEEDGSRWKTRRNESRKLFPRRKPKSSERQSVIGMLRCKSRKQIRDFTALTSRRRHAANGMKKKRQSFADGRGMRLAMTTALPGRTFPIADSKPPNSLTSLCGGSNGQPPTSSGDENSKSAEEKKHLLPLQSQDHSFIVIDDSSDENSLPQSTIDTFSDHRLGGHDESAQHPHVFESLSAPFPPDHSHFSEIRYASANCHNVEQPPTTFIARHPSTAQHPLSALYSPGRSHFAAIREASATASELPLSELPLSELPLSDSFERNCHNVEQPPTTSIPSTASDLHGLPLYSDWFESNVIEKVLGKVKAMDPSHRKETADVVADVLILNMEIEGSKKYGCGVPGCISTKPGPKANALKHARSAKHSHLRGRITDEVNDRLRRGVVTKSQCFGFEFLSP